jgi:molybdate transport system substrate-binding protein
MKRGLGFLVAAVVLVAASCHREETAKPQITVAAAANLSGTAQALGSQFESQTGIHPLFSFASTAELTSQIENGAPFDVFLAADAQHIDQLGREGLLVPGSDAVYAIGVLALWAPSTSPAVQRIEDLVSPEVRVIAVAKPELAPYGEATVQALHRAGLWDKVKNKIVYAENINMAREYGASKNADAVFTAYSLVSKESGQVIQVDEALHQPISQKLGVIAASMHKPEAQKFANFVKGGTGREILANQGYRLP